MLNNEFRWLAWLFHAGRGLWVSRPMGTGYVPETSAISWIASLRKQPALLPFAPSITRNGTRYFCLLFLSCGATPRWAPLVDYGDPSILPTSFNAFVAMLVQRCKIFPQLLVCRRYSVSFLHRRKSEVQVAERGRMEPVLM